MWFVYVQKNIQHKAAKLLLELFGNFKNLIDLAAGLEDNPHSNIFGALQILLNLKFILINQYSE